MSNNTVPDDPIACLKEIAVIAMDRINKASDIAAMEAFTLGRITGVATRRPEVMEHLRAVEKNRQRKEGS